MNLINTPEFQRLKHVKQLAAVHHVFPSATHSRFEHSLGVGHLAERFAISLKRNQPDLAIDPFVFKLAGLCHDLGHGPLSHVFDRVWDVSHEERSVQRLLDLVKKYKIEIPDEVVSTACEIIHPKTHSLDDFMYQIICNEIDHIDVDKMDYLARDSYFTGMFFKVDFDRFFSYSKVLDGRICYSKKSMQQAINHLFLTRHQMHCQVYQHPVVRAFEMLYSDFLRLVCNEDDWVCTDSVFSVMFLDSRLLSGRLDTKTHEKACRILDDIAFRNIPKFLREQRLDDEMTLCEDPSSTEFFKRDVVTIGYSTHPLLCVNFFCEDGRVERVDETQLLSIYPMKQRDVIERIYSLKCDRR